MGTKVMQERKPRHKRSITDSQNDSKILKEAVNIIGSCMD